MKYKVTYEQEVVLTYEAIVEADSEEEAKEMLEDGRITGEEEIDSQGISVSVVEIVKVEDE
jgi:hypothetical protein